MSKVSRKIETVLNVLFWGAVTAASVYTIKVTVDELRDPVEKEKRKKERDDACSIFNKFIDKACDVTKRVYRKIADVDEAIDNAIPPYGEEHREKYLASLKSKKEKLEQRIRDLEA